MNYREMLDFHLSRNADMTVAAVPVPRKEASSFGILKVDAQGAVENFLEKPARPPGMPGSPDYSLASMGVYIFRARTLVEEVIKDAKKKTGKHDFGGDIIPQMVGRKKVFAFNFADPDGTPRYWRDTQWRNSRSRRPVCRGPACRPKQSRGTRACLRSRCLTLPIGSRQCSDQPSRPLRQGR